MSLYKNQSSTWWSAVIRDDPGLAYKCDKWCKFSDWDWAYLISGQNQFASKCNNWAWDLYVWIYLLERQPQFTLIFAIERYLEHSITHAIPKREIYFYS